MQTAHEQQMLDGMPARLYSCTPTRLLTWLDCPRRFRFTYLDRPAPPKGPPWAHTSIGASAHAALAQWWALPFPRRLPATGAELVRRGWVAEGFRDDAQSAAARERAARWVEEYLLRVDPAQQPVGVERVVATPTTRLAVSGRVDRIDLRDGRLVVVDYKTGRRPPTDDDARASLALALYAVAAARTLRHPSGRVELHHLPTGAVAVAEHGEAALARKVAEAESIARDAFRAETAYAQASKEGAGMGEAGETGQAGESAQVAEQWFPPNPSRSCSWCDFRRHCPEGQAAAPDLEPWAAVHDSVAVEEPDESGGVS